MRWEGAIHSKLRRECVPSDGGGLEGRGQGEDSVTACHDKGVGELRGEALKVKRGSGADFVPGC